MVLSAHAFLSPFNHFFALQALVNNPCAVDKKFTIIYLILRSQPLYVSKNPFVMDAAKEQSRYYVGCENIRDLDLKSSPICAPASDVEQNSHDEEYETSVTSPGMVLILLDAFRPKNQCATSSLETESNKTEEIELASSKIALNHLGTRNFRCYVSTQFDRAGSIKELGIPFSRSIVSHSITEKSPRRLSIANSDTDSDNDPQEYRNSQITCTPINSHILAPRVTTQSASHSEAATVTS